MKSIKEIILLPEEAFDQERFLENLYAKAKINKDSGDVIIPLKRSIDARSKQVRVRVQYEIVSKEQAVNQISYSNDLPNVQHAKQVIIIGCGPAGMFAALRLIESGIKPIILERGKEVQARRRDIAAINKAHTVHPDSNYCFGEGGAGTYSDGKLYTRSTKRGDIRRILEIFVAHGAKEDILFDAHPHIGTNKLPQVVEAIRKTILHAGGEIHFNTRIVDFEINNQIIHSVTSANGDKFEGEAVILATGHSARDIFHLLHQKKIFIEAKPFALGVRVEHAQQLIDKIQYHCETDRGIYLPASSYSLVHQTTFEGVQRGVFSFCMCPGGFIVPSATSPGEVVVNGMSPSRRDSRFANSGIVASVNLVDLSANEKHGPLAVLYFQQAIEQQACTLVGGTQTAPAQRLEDFVNGKTSASLLETSYQPGLVSVDMRSVLPDFIYESLREGFIAFGKKMKGYLSNEAQVVGVESRTSSPVRIPRDKDSLEHVQIKRLFPCGEGAGYAGGIVSAAMDGEMCAEAVLKSVLKILAV